MYNCTATNAAIDNAMASAMGRCFIFCSFLVMVVALDESGCGSGCLIARAHVRAHAVETLAVPGKFWCSSLPTSQPSAQQTKHKICDEGNGCSSYDTHYAYYPTQ